MKKILWFSNCILSNKNNKASGSWLYSMAKLLLDTNDIYLVNITVDRTRKDDKIKHLSDFNFEEFILPTWKIDKNGFPNQGNINKIDEICRSVNADLIHVWGVENYFCNLVPTLKLHSPMLLEIQGLHEPCGKVFYGDMSLREIFSCFGLREILFPHLKSIFALKAEMIKKGESDKKAIRKYRYISTQSQWVRNHLQGITNARLFQTGMSLRTEFWNSRKWEYPQDKNINFYCSAAGAVPYKSVQTAIKALSVVVKKYPNTKLHIIGNFKNSSSWLHKLGYLTYLYKLIKSHDLQDNIVFDGPLNANEIIKVALSCVGMIQTSYVESYSLALAEAQALGVPSIVSFAGAMPELATDTETGLFFPTGDYISCASKMTALIEDKKLALRLSVKSCELAFSRNNDESVLKKQLNIYNEIIC